jgi:hypothetical protein
MNRGLEGTTDAVIAADTAHLAHLGDGEGSERRGLLRALARTEMTGTRWWRRVLRLS